MELLKELLILTVRILTIIPLMLLTTIYMGKRSIGELPVFDFLVIITLGAVVGADIADPEISHIHTAVAIVLIGLFQRIVSNMVIKHRKLGHIITFEPTIVIQDGKLIYKNLKKLRYSVDNVLQMLREKDIFDINDVYLGIIEANGRMSVLKKDSKTSVTLEDMNLTKKSCAISYPIIIDGKIYVDVLQKLNISETWIKEQLAAMNIGHVDKIFFASVNNKRELHVSLKSDLENVEDLLPIYH
ncbi:Uncharacterized membrane protein YcaP, DUF421 family [Alkalithermobacter thermoalcaliphilus JW-YL-7 = DSM 7308]|uniref:Uncharacterized membrane protein YcaP, DUF421 family n=1 Tax=Alkalithermobacter thermoalcaliphilus JW-YL-7 = DSM 7308 TaxID=1121328 RepID=A0A150FPV2_CLOPD|nr:protein of unknown function DUF421 [[Clostridium] paradoxum JW-YL-7 = DSM 7308]SHK87148.1 Uncharacterized membrane protein YcaP, DUF421 family [[Clostridium] paradoxum JW-YL-7 = DSM 7308]